MKLKIEEKQRIEQELQKLGTILEEKIVDIQTIQEYKRLEEELEKYCFSIVSPHKLVSVLQYFNQIGYNPLKIVKELARIKSLKHLKNDCKILVPHISRYKEIIPLCEQIKRFGIGFSELAAFHAAVMKKSDMEIWHLSVAGVYLFLAG